MTEPGWGNVGGSYTIPVPEGGFKPATGSDGHLDVFNPKTGQYWSFFGVDTANGTVVSAKVADNIFSSNGFGATASGLADSVGTIHAGELDTATSLTHAIAISLPGNVLNNSYSNETAATQSDGLAQYAGAPFSEGGKVALPADFNPAAHGIQLTTAGMAIVNALKNYGAIVSSRNDVGSNSIGIASDYAPGNNPALEDINAIVPYLEYYGGTKQTKSY